MNDRLQCPVYVAVYDDGKSASILMAEFEVTLPPSSDRETARLFSTVLDMKLRDVEVQVATDSSIKRVITKATLVSRKGSYMVRCANTLFVYEDGADEVFELVARVITENELEGA